MVLLTSSAPIDIRLISGIDIPLLISSMAVNHRLLIWEELAEEPVIVREVPNAKFPGLVAERSLVVLTEESIIEKTPSLASVEVTRSGLIITLREFPELSNPYIMRISPVMLLI